MVIADPVGLRWVVVGGTESEDVGSGEITQVPELVFSVIAEEGETTCSTGTMVSKSLSSDWVARSIMLESSAGFKIGGAGSGVTSGTAEGVDVGGRTGRKSTSCGEGGCEAFVTNISLDKMKPFCGIALVLSVSSLGDAKNFSKSGEGSDVDGFSPIAIGQK